MNRRGLFHLLVPLIFVLGVTPLRGQDTIVVRADNRPAWGDSLQIVEELRIGALDSLPEYTFGRVVGVVPTVDGGVFVADEYATVIRRYDASGTYLGDVGRAGSGPGEYYQILGMKPYRSDSLAVWDPRNGRISIFAADGEFTRSITFHTGFFTADPFQVDTTGRFYVKGLAPGPRRPAGHPTAMVWIGLNAEGAVFDTIPIPVASDEQSFVSYSPTGPLWPFLIQTRSYLSPHGYQVVGKNSDYQINRPLADGRVVRIERSYDPVEIGPEEREEWQARIDYVVSQLGGESSIRMPRRFKPAFRDFFVDTQGRIWISRYVAADFVGHTSAELRRRGDRPTYQWKEQPTWEVLDPRGQFLGRVATPRNGWVAAVVDRTIWIVERGEFDENYVVRYRIVSGN